MILYGGFCDGKLHWYYVDDGFGGSNWRRVPALFSHRQQARVQFEDVRRVVVVEEKPKKKVRKR
jgi:hypothetical protein